MAKGYIIGVDCSTTASKAIVWDREGMPVAEGREKMQILTPKPEWVEQDANEWWNATAVAIKKAVRQIDAGKVVAICLTHQRESFVPVDEDFKPLRNGILWVDTRAASQVEKLREKSENKVIEILFKQQ